MGDPNCVHVAVRARPQSEREKVQNNRICTNILREEAQITIGSDKGFTYDYAFDTGTQQQTVYDECVTNLVEGTFEGFNATVLAYGQTGSGKTYTMGTAFDMVDEMKEDEVGIIPRAIRHLFSGMESRKQQALEQGYEEPCFDVVAQFVELYNEDVLDLLSHQRAPTGLRIHEDAKGEIFLQGVTQVTVASPTQTLELLKNGALKRKTAATNMNEQSSRSHAIFTMIIKQRRTVIIKPSPDPQADGDASSQENLPATELELLSAKFHFVDLAGSERLKRTGATGDRAKEGININFGLLALGNVISALTTTPSTPDKSVYVPYRQSKLTRLLQDSLGGNSRTLMIACISPSECDYVETLNTLQYASRAKKIQNKVVANQDKSSQLIGHLRSRIAKLEAELLDFKQGRITVADGVESLNDQYRENVLLQADVNQLRIRIKALQETVEMLRARNVQLLADKDEACTKMHILQNQNQQTSDGVFNAEGPNNESGEQEHGALTVRIYLDEMESLRCALMESHATNEQLHQQIKRWKAIATNNTQRMPLGTLTNCNDIINGVSGTNMERVITPRPASLLIEEAKADIERMKQSITGSLADNEKTNEGTRSHGDDAVRGGMMGDFDGNGDVDELRDDEDGDIEVENEAETECFKLSDDLVDLQGEISIRERLVLELEQSQRLLAEVQTMYERKLKEFTDRISAMEYERDRVLAEMASKHPQKVVDGERERKIRDDYEKKLTAIRNEFKKLESVSREHRKAQAKQAAQQQQLLRLKSELSDLKKTKVQLMQRIKEEAQRAKAIELANMKKLASLEKESRKKDSIIQKLQTKDRQREEYLKRSTDEMNRLRQEARRRNVFDRKTERNGTQRSLPTTSLRQGRGMIPLTRLQVNKAKAKWLAIEKNIRRRISQRQAISKMEDELEKIVAEKNLLAEEIQRLEQQFISSENMAERDLIGEHIDGCHDKMRYIQEQFTELQNTIAGIGNENIEDSAAEDTEACQDAEKEIENCSSIGEAVIILKHLFRFSLEQGFIAAKAISDKKGADLVIQELKNESNLSDTILNEMLEDAKRNAEQQKNSRDVSPEWEGKEVPAVNNENQAAPNSRDNLNGASLPSPTRKIRRRTAIPSELLFPVHESSPQRHVTDESQLSEIADEETQHFPQRTVEKARSSPEGEQSPGLGNLSMESRSEVITLNDVDLDDRASAESSPATRGNRRRTGRIVPYVPQILTGTRDRTATSRLLVRTHTLDGHTRSVLSVDANDTAAISGSKDRTVKVWDLEKGVEKCTFANHPNNVSCVRFIPASQMALSLSMAFVRIWDLRNDECVRTLYSSGLAASDNVMAANSPRQTELPVSETMISALELDDTGKLLFTTFNSDVRIWNLEKLAPFGRLSSATHGSRSEVSCLRFLGGAKPKVFTGSRDHYVKVYEINADGLGLFEASHEFSAAHYDSVTSIVAHGDSIFSASKDTNIMRFSLRDMKRDHIELQAHNNWIQSMCILDTYRPLLVTACKEGRLKVWDITSTRKLRLVEQVPHAHEEAINELATHSGILFSASSDTTVAIWH